MIGYITGKIKFSEGKEVIVQTESGVGYLVNMVSGVAGLNQDAVEVFIHTAVKEDDISLWGFANREDLKLFKLLLSVSGVGLRTAQALLEVKGISQIVNAVRDDSPADLKAPGIGKKTAERIILDLRNRLDDFDSYIDETQTSVGEGSAKGFNQQKNIMLQDAMDAVESLGYLRKDIDKVVKQLDIDSFENAQSIVKIILKNI